MRRRPSGRGPQGVGQRVSVGRETLQVVVPRPRHAGQPRCWRDAQQTLRCARARSACRARREAAARRRAHLAGLPQCAAGSAAQRPAPRSSATVPAPPCWCRAKPARSAQAALPLPATRPGRCRVNGRKHPPLAGITRRYAEPGRAHVGHQLRLAADAATALAVTAIVDHVEVEVQAPVEVDIDKPLDQVAAVAMQEEHHAIGIGLCRCSAFSRAPGTSTQVSCTSAPTLKR